MKDYKNKDFSNQDLTGRKFTHCDLSYCNFTNAILKNVNFFGSLMYDCKLDGADFEGAYMAEADMRFCRPWRAKNLDKAKCVPMINPWHSGITGDKITIGCRTWTIEKWEEFFSSDEVINCDRESKHFRYIEATYRGLKAYYLHLKNYMYKELIESFEEIDKIFDNSRDQKAKEQPTKNAEELEEYLQEYKINNRDIVRVEEYTNTDVIDLDDVVEFLQKEYANQIKMPFIDSPKQDKTIKL